MPLDMADRNEDENRPAREVARAVIQLDRMFQIVLILPASVFVGWLIGLGLDGWLGQHWIYLVGIFVGFASGMMQILRMLREMEKKLDQEQAGKLAAGKETGSDGRIKEEPK